jgi:hypothetical protein
MDLIDDQFPARQGIGAIEPWDPRVVARRGVRHPGSLSDDQPHLPLGAPAVVVGERFARDAFGGERTRHRRHHNSIGEIEAADRQRLEQRRSRPGGTLARHQTRQLGRHSASISIACDQRELATRCLIRHPC